MAGTLRHTVADNVARIAAERCVTDSQIMSALAFDERALRLLKIGARPLLVDSLADLAALLKVSVADLVIPHTEPGPPERSAKA